MNKGYAFGFLIILLVLGLGLYVAYTGFISSREALRAQPTSPPGKVGQATRPPANPQSTASEAVSPTATLTPPVILTPTLEVTITSAGSPTGEGEPALPTKPPAPVPTEPPPPPPTALPTVATPQVQPPTPVPVPSYQFRLAGPPQGDPNYPSCCYILGTIRDAAGNGLEGVQVQVGNEWNPPVKTASKGGVDLGKYDIPIGRDLVTWYVLLVDDGGNQISTKVQVQFDPNVANAFRVDWQRTF